MKAVAYETIYNPSTCDGAGYFEIGGLLCSRG